MMNRSQAEKLTANNGVNKIQVQLQRVLKHIEYVALDGDTEVSIPMDRLPDEVLEKLKALGYLVSTNNTCKKCNPSDRYTIRWGT